LARREYAAPGALRRRAWVSVPAEQTPAGKRVCRFCAGREWDTFYAVTTDPIQAKLKLGISSNGGKRRLAQRRAAGYHHVVRLLTSLVGDTAPLIERAARNPPSRGPRTDKGP
jgi:hypothetical protein